MFGLDPTSLSYLASIMPQLMQGGMDGEGDDKGESSALTVGKKAEFASVSPNPMDTVSEPGRTTWEAPGDAYAPGASVPGPFSQETAEATAGVMAGAEPGRDGPGYGDPGRPRSISPSNGPTDRAPNGIGNYLEWRRARQGRGMRETPGINDRTRRMGGY